MNSNNIVGFRDFASKLREQAKKLPSFDDMAAKDKYIHTEEFNVRNNNNTDSSISTTNNSNNNVDEASYSTESSWSLLDRPTVAVAMGTQAKRNNDSDNSLTDNENNSTDEILSIADSRQKSAKSTSIPLLSIVSDALQQTPPTRNPIFPSISQDEDDNSDDDDSYSNSDHSSEGLMDDEEDPILSMIRNNNNDNISNRKQPATTSVTTKKSSNRFMDDLRLQTPTENENYIQQKQETTTTTQHQQPKIIGGFFNRILRRGSDSASKVPISLPPLNFQRTPKAIPVKQEEENFEITTSTLVLGDEDLKQLEQLKKGGGGSSSSQNQHYIFIVFTLLLAIFVYFYTRKDIEDDVT
jgi:hypothetical protein